VFNLAITFMIGENLMGMTGVFIFTLPLMIVLVLLIRRTNHYTREELADHVRDYPYSPAAGKKGG
jgi:putative membrane protein